MEVSKAGSYSKFDTQQILPKQMDNLARKKGHVSPSKHSVMVVSRGYKFRKQSPRKTFFI
jgi:hypothetical protein